VAAAAPLEWIWRRSSPFLLMGFCVLGDLKRLAVSFPALMNSTTDSETEIRLMELKRLAAFRRVPIEKWGLSKLYFACFGREVNKEQQCSDWGCRPLTASQLEYAAMDAHVVRSVALHLLADLELDWDQVGHFMYQFLVTIPSLGSNRLAADLQVLGKPHVHAAIRDLGLDSAVHFHTISKDVWVENPHHESGLVVKTIAVAIKHQPSSKQSAYTFAVVVLQLDRIIDMEALAACVGSSPDDVSLADQRTLIRVFGYSRGCVGPIGLRQQEAVRVIIDKRLEHEYRLLCGAGALNEVYSIAPDLLISTVGAVTADISTC
jgi:prolyl-tRNA editing enzyme YbaK/EbsC (Cys-tRNA(Pro) deacylase)